MCRGRAIGDQHGTAGAAGPRAPLGPVGHDPALGRDPARPLPCAAMTDLALCGAGRITMAHALAAAAVPGLRITRVASRDPARAAERATQVGARPCRYDELPDGADVVLVATPPARHAEDALRALAGGAVALVETPLCTTLADADRLVAADHRAGGGRLAYGENLVHSPIVTEARRRAGALGPLTYVETRALQPRPAGGGATDAAWGGGALFDLGAHPLAAALLLAGDDPAVAVRARLDADDGLGVDDEGELWLRFRSGLAAHVVASWRYETTVWDIQASSETGVVRAELAPTATVERDGEPVGLPGVRPGVDVAQIDQFGFVAQLEDVGRVAAGGGPPRSGAELGRAVLEVVCAAYASAGDGGTEVALPFAGPRDRTPVELWRPAGTGR